MMEFEDEEEESGNAEDDESLNMVLLESEDEDLDLAADAPVLSLVEDETYEVEEAEPAKILAPSSVKDLSRSKAPLHEDEFDPLADSSFSTVVPAPPPLPGDGMHLELLPHDSDLDLSSFSDLKPHETSHGMKKSGLRPLELGEVSESEDIHDPFGMEESSSSSDTLETYEEANAQEEDLPDGDLDPFAIPQESPYKKEQSTASSDDILPPSLDEFNLATEAPSSQELDSLSEFDPLADSSITPANATHQKLPLTPSFNSEAPSLDWSPPMDPPQNEEMPSAGLSPSENFNPLADSNYVPDLDTPLGSEETQAQASPFFISTSEGYPTLPTSQADPQALTPISTTEAEEEAQNSLPLQSSFSLEDPPLSLNAREEEEEEEADLLLASPDLYEKEKYPPSKEPKEPVTLSEKANLTKELQEQEFQHEHAQRQLQQILKSTKNESAVAGSLVSQVFRPLVHYKRKIIVRAFKQMRTLQNFPLVVHLMKEDLQTLEMEHTPAHPGTPQAQAPVIELVPYFPGCLCVPDRVTLQVAPAHQDFQFWITPLTTGNLKDARLTLLYHHIPLQSVKIPTQIHRFRQTHFFAALTLIAPLLYPLSQRLGFELFPYLSRWSSSLPTLQTLGGPVNVGIYLGALFFLLTVLSYFIQRPKEHRPLQQFFELEA
jgi:hypothetical protein